MPPRPGSRDDWWPSPTGCSPPPGRSRRPATPAITLPGPEGGYGRAVDGLEGFARTFLLAGFRIAGERGEGLDELARLVRGAASPPAPTPRSPERWVRLDEHPQAKVEAASIALILDLTRPWIWDRLPPAVQERVVDVPGPGGRRRHVPAHQLGLVPPGRADLPALGRRPALARRDGRATSRTHDTLRPRRRLAGRRRRARLRPLRRAGRCTCTRRCGPGWPAPPTSPTGRRERDLAALDRFLLDAVALVGADGSPLMQGRSLIYRFAAAAPFWVGALAGVPSVSPGRLRRAATGIVRTSSTTARRTSAACSPSAGTAPWPRLAQSYSGPGSPYWASKGMLGLALPADHPVWTAAEEPLPVEERDALRAVRAPGWLVSGTRADGIVRVVNHGTDHAVEGATVADSPLYARLGYSTATSPVLDDSGWLRPARPVRHPRRRRGPGHPPRRHAHCSTVHVDADGVGVAGSRAARPLGRPGSRSARPRRRPRRAGPDRPGTSRCTRSSAAPGSCG